MQYKQVSHEIKELDDAKGIVVAYASVYNNVDSDNEIITDRKSTRLNSSHIQKSRMPSSA